MSNETSEKKGMKRNGWRRFGFEFDNKELLELRRPSWLADGKEREPKNGKNRRWRKAAILNDEGTAVRGRLERLLESRVQRRDSARETRVIIPH